MWQQENWHKTLTSRRIRSKILNVNRQDNDYAELATSL